jgi:hypothetical protein
MNESQLNRLFRQIVSCSYVTGNYDTYLNRVAAAIFVVQCPVTAQFFPMFWTTPRAKGKKATSVTSTPILRSQRIPGSPAIKQEKSTFLLQTNVLSIQQQGVIPPSVSSIIM